MFAVSPAVEDGAVDIKHFSLKMEFMGYSEAPVCRITFPMAFSYALFLDCQAVYSALF